MYCQFNYIDKEKGICPLASISNEENYLCSIVCSYWADILYDLHGKDNAEVRFLSGHLLNKDDDLVVCNMRGPQYMRISGIWSKWNPETMKVNGVYGFC